jgi:hypothetical protein
MRGCSRSPSNRKVIGSRFNRAGLRCKEGWQETKNFLDRDAGQSLAFYVADIADVGADRIFAISGDALFHFLRRQGLLVCSKPVRKCLCIEGMIGPLRSFSQIVFHLLPPSSVLDVGGKVGGARRQRFQEKGILARKCYWLRRYRLGVIPNFWRNRVVRCEWLEKPLSRAISVRAVGASSSRRRACSRRSPCRY